MITAGIYTCRHQSHCCGPIQDESTFRWPSCHIAQLVAFTCTQGRRYLLVLTRLRIATDPGDSLHFLGIIDKGKGQHSLTFHIHLISSQVLSACAGSATERLTFTATERLTFTAQLQPQRHHRIRSLWRDTLPAAAPGHPASVRLIDWIAVSTSQNGDQTTWAAATQRVRLGY